MGLVQKIFYYHMPSAWMFLVAAIVCGVASVPFLFGKTPGHDRLRAGRPRSWSVLFGAADAGHRAAVGAQGVGRVVGVGRAADVEPHAAG